MIELLVKIINDLRKIDLPVDDVEVFIRPPSKSYYGRYFPSRKVIYLYPFISEGVYYDYDSIFKTMVHEMCHHLQYSDKNFVRHKNNMHSIKFWKLYNKYIKSAQDKGIINYEKAV